MEINFKIYFEVYTKLGLHDKLKQRRELINYTPIIQLKLF